MAQFTVNATRFDPYKNFKFRVKWDGRYVAGVSKVSALKRTTEMVEHREGGDPSTSHKSPGRNKFEAVTLERGGMTLVMKNVPARVCENCGEAYMDESVTEHLLEVAEKAFQAGVQVEIRQFIAA